MQIPKEEEIYIAPGQKPFERENLRPAEEEEMILGPPIVDNDDLCRQRFAIKDHLTTLRTTLMADINSKELPSEALKPAIKNNFYIKEQRYNTNDFVEPDDEQNKNKQTGKHLEEYIQSYRLNPRFVEQRDRTTKSLK